MRQRNCASRPFHNLVDFDFRRVSVEVDERTAAADLLSEQVSFRYGDGSGRRRSGYFAGVGLRVDLISGPIGKLDPDCSRVSNGADRRRSRL